jgi:hypothetical protein
MTNCKQIENNEFFHFRTRHFLFNLESSNYKVENISYGYFQRVAAQEREIKHSNRY